MKQILEHANGEGLLGVPISMYIQLYIHGMVRKHICSMWLLIIQEY